ncbi:MAG TPA: ABC transporter permease [Solirubrobacteraceae bacterium]|nr:ABC transporter permease [Solirubrobacteraceae bacterium]
MSAIAPSRLLPADVPLVGSVGLRTRRLRAALSALGIAIGIASMVAVLGISESSRSDLIATLDQLGTNLLEVAPGQSFLGEDTTLPKTAAQMIARVPAVVQVAQLADVDANVFRNDHIPDTDTGGISVQAADTTLPAALGARLAAGRFLDPATENYPTVVLGAEAARRLGITSVRSRPRVWLGGRWFTVVGILAPVTLAPDLDRAALVGLPVAERVLGSDGTASTIYVRADPERLERVRALLGRTASPARPEEVQVSRPSDALAARAAAKTAFTSLFLGLGAVALLVGGVGIANVMFVSVLERRPEIGLRRALGATRRHIWLQFSTESLLLAALGGAAGVAIGVLVTIAYATSQGWAWVVPPVAAAGGMVAALAIGALAGLYPALRAARMSPTEALRSP